jgi:coenzyme PQQ synthesis protein D (PqqD)
MTVKEDAFEKVWCPSENVVTRKIIDETILVPISGNLANMQQIFSINEVGSAIWALMDGEKNVRLIKQALISEFDVEEAQLDIDIFEFIDYLIDLGLVQEVPV